MKKRIAIIALALFTLVAAGTVFADEYLQCREPSDGSITVSFMGDSVVATYSGKSAQAFEVVILLKDGTTEYMTFSFPKIKAEQTRRLIKKASGVIEKITHCDLTTAY